MVNNNQNTVFFICKTDGGFVIKKFLFFKNSL